MLFAICLWNACTYEKGEPIIPIEPESCDTTTYTYSNEISTIFQDHCTGCHGTSGQLNLQTYNDMMAGGINGSPIVIFDPDNSLLWQKIENNTMPPSSPLADSLKSKIQLWINEGACQ